MKSSPPQTRHFLEEGRKAQTMTTTTTWPKQGWVYQAGGFKYRVLYNMPDLVGDNHKVCLYRLGHGNRPPAKVIQSLYLVNSMTRIG